jgi:hypothetical protein
VSCAHRAGAPVDAVLGWRMLSLPQRSRGLALRRPGRLRGRGHHHLATDDVLRNHSLDFADLVSAAHLAAASATLGRLLMETPGWATCSRAFSRSTCARPTRLEAGILAAA